VLKESWTGRHCTLALEAEFASAGACFALDQQRVKGWHVVGRQEAAQRGAYDILERLVEQFGKTVVAVEHGAVFQQSGSAFIHGLDEEPVGVSAPLRV